MRYELAWVNDWRGRTNFYCRPLVFGFGFAHDYVYVEVVVMGFGVFFDAWRRE